MRAVLLPCLILPLSLAQAQSLQVQPHIFQARDGRGVQAEPGTLTVPAAALPPFAQVIEREVPALMKEARIQGAAVGLIVGGKLVYAKGFGFADHAGKVPVTPDTVFVAASLAKPIASWVTMRLAEQGRVQLDKPVADVLSPWPLAQSPFDPRLITIRRLLSHTAGTTLGGYQGWLDFKELPSATGPDVHTCGTEHAARAR
ncbi:serine hydrolase [Corallococcus sp. BB11-1]|uniref:serine hydrolase domain-containing protein n=1 Tax=Corallococcus sp. BB11-1 TaxID=2996783 RepID=UPI002270AE39|nr:serine hydrolase domain-containing protein [Corallococcus sp. BB11-1]MCY1033308.1 serine hydrolase [Corallococcus sp. BB11-1]